MPLYRVAKKIVNRVAYSTFLKLVFASVFVVISTVVLVDKAASVAGGSVGRVIGEDDTDKAAQSDPWSILMGNQKPVKGNKYIPSKRKTKRKKLALNLFES